ncbi:hypothetical protein A3Q56_02570 [Intoshia linei]|uniref:LIM zinc-binding domain-containing protein n=1 Tax=Intoshia linei TaxID=1819745 RepID=A0A177B624_9BILA|nr:hypothetical protein A3Q56_02570 [Intoshia linei]
MIANSTKLNYEICNKCKKSVPKQSEPMKFITPIHQCEYDCDKNINGEFECKQQKDYIDLPIDDFDLEWKSKLVSWKIKMRKRSQEFRNIKNELYNKQNDPRNIKLKTYRQIVNEIEERNCICDIDLLQKNGSFKHSEMNAETFTIINKSATDKDVSDISNLNEYNDNVSSTQEITTNSDGQSETDMVKCDSSAQDSIDKKSSTISYPGYVSDIPNVFCDSSSASASEKLLSDALDQMSQNLSDTSIIRNIGKKINQKSPKSLISNDMDFSKNEQELGLTKLNLNIEKALMIPRYPEIDRIEIDHEIKQKKYLYLMKCKNQVKQTVNDSYSPEFNENTIHKKNLKIVNSSLIEKYRKMKLTNHFQTSNSPKPDIHVERCEKIKVAHIKITPTIPKPFSEHSFILNSRSPSLTNNLHDKNETLEIFKPRSRTPLDISVYETLKNCEKIEIFLKESCQTNQSPVPIDQIQNKTPAPITKANHKRKSVTFSNKPPIFIPHVVQCDSAQGTDSSNETKKCYNLNTRVDKTDLHCSFCLENLEQCNAMMIDSLGMFFHVNCFKCFVCHQTLGNGKEGAKVRIKYNKLHCKDCYNMNAVQYSDV